MTRTKYPLTMQGSPAALGRPAQSPFRQAAAWALLAASAALDRLAQRVAMPVVKPEALALAELEFYAQAGAPEGALYVDGQLVGWLPGVQRL